MVTRIAIPLDIKEIYMNIALSLDIMFVIKVKFMMKISRNIKFITDNYIPIRIKDLT